MPSQKVPSSVVSTTGSLPAVVGGGGGAGSILAHLNDAVDAHDGSAISYDGGPAWADGTTNPAAEVETQLDKVITDLTATTSPNSGGHKIGVGITATWWDATGISASSVADAINEVVSDLASTTASLAGVRKIGSEEFATGSSFGTVLTSNLHGHLSDLFTNAPHLSNNNDFRGNNTFGISGGNLILDGASSGELQFTNATSYHRINAINEETQVLIGTSGVWNFVESFGGTPLWTLLADGGGVAFIDTAVTIQTFTNTAAHLITAAYSDLTWDMAGTNWDWKVSDDALNTVVLGVARKTISSDHSLKLGVHNLEIVGDSVAGFHASPALHNANWRYSKPSGTGANNGADWTFSAPQGQNQTGGADNNDGGAIRFSTGAAGVGGSGALGHTGPLIFHMHLFNDVRHYYVVDRAVDGNTSVAAIWTDPEGALAVGETVYAIVRRLSVFSGAGAQPTGTGFANSMFQVSHCYMYWTRNSTNTNVGANPPDIDIKGNPIFDQETNHSIDANVPGIEPEYQGNIAGDTPSGLRDVHYFIQVFRAKDTDA